MQQTTDRNRLDTDRKVIAIVFFGFLCTLLLVFLIHFSINTSSGIRAFLAVEGVWSKAQKEAVNHLTNFIVTDEEEKYERFQSVLRINLGDRAAREELIKEDSDYGIMHNGFIAGRNHPDDIPDMINLYERFYWLNEIDAAFEAWRLGDEKIDELIEFATHIQATITEGRATPEMKNQWVEELMELDHDLTDYELEFAEQMGSLARHVNKLIRWSSIVIGLLLLALGVFLVYRFLKSTERWTHTLEQSEQEFRTLLQNSRDVLYKMSLKTQKYEYVSPGIEEMLNYSTEEFLKGGPQWIYSLIHEEDKKNMAKIIERYSHINEDGFLPVVEFRLKDKNGKFKWVSNSRTLVRDEDGEPEAIVGSVRDISDKKAQDEELRESLQEKEILLQEIHHRVKNNLAIVSSLLELQKDGVDPEIKELFSASQSRIQSIAKVHEKLYESTSLADIPMDVYITELVEEISRAYQSDEQRICIETDLVNYSMELNQAIPCGLVLNELINNCYKHGFEGLKEGIIRITLKEKDNGMELRVENNGNPLPENFDMNNSTSLGMTLIQVLTKRFNGDVTIDQDDWTRVSIYFYA